LYRIPSAVVILLEKVLKGNQSITLFSPSQEMILEDRWAKINDVLMNLCGKEQESHALRGSTLMTPRR
jgi:hypothetical protein